MIVTAYSALLQLVMPEVIVVIAALIVLAVDLLSMRGSGTRDSTTVQAEA